MRSAGAAAFRALLDYWPEADRIAVFCGGGNNGGDGYVIARLALEAGLQVWVFSIVDVANLQGEALHAYQDFISVGGGVLDFHGSIPESDVIVDALLGTGLTRAVSDQFERAILAMNTSATPVLAVDIPSGLHADTGQVLGYAVRAQLTVTFIALKAGLFNGQAVNYRGKVICADLQIPQPAFSGVSVFAELTKRRALPRRVRDAHKGCFGHVLLVGGNQGYGGAIRLAAEAALRSGAGLASIASHPFHSAWLNAGRPELMCHAVESPNGLPALLDRASVVVIGPGLGQDDWASQLFQQVLASEKPVVVDADALNLLAHSPQWRQNWLLTPHPGEAARLLGCTTAKIAEDRYHAARQLQNQYGGVCVLKGAGSIIASDASLTVATSGNPGMASGGMGDVLAGLCGGLMAQSWAIDQAACLAVQIHGEAADLAAEQNGERGLLASDLFPLIRRLLNT